MFNASRSAIQVLSCRAETVIASFSITGDMAQVAQLTLAGAPTDLKAHAALAALGFAFERKNAAPAPALDVVVLRAARPPALGTFADYRAGSSF